MLRRQGLLSDHRMDLDTTTFIIIAKSDKTYDKSIMGRFEWLIGMILRSVVVNLERKECW